MKRNHYAPPAAQRKAMADTRRRANFERDVWRACINECNNRAKSYQTHNKSQWAIYHIGNHHGRQLPDRIMALVTRVGGRVMVTRLDKSGNVSSVTMYHPDTMICKALVCESLALESNEFHMARF